MHSYSHGTVRSSGIGRFWNTCAVVVKQNNFTYLKSVEVGEFLSVWIFLFIYLKLVCMCVAASFHQSYPYFLVYHASELLSRCSLGSKKKNICYGDQHLAVSMSLALHQ